MLIATLFLEQMVSDGHAITEEKNCLILRGVKRKEIGLFAVVVV